MNNNALIELIRQQGMPRRNVGFSGQEGEMLNMLAMQPEEQMQPMNTIRTSSGEYITPGGGRSMQPAEFGQAPQPPQMRGSPVDVFGQGKGFMQPDGTIIGINAQGQRFSVNPAGTAAAGQAARDAELKRRMMMAQVKEQEMRAQGGGMSPSDQLAREKFEWEKAQGKPQDKAQVERIQTATDALDLIQQAKGIFDAGKATESLAGKARDIGLGMFGASTEGAQAAAQLKALGGALVAKMPKMTGPQSDKDVLLYREMAGQIADETVPIETRRAALSTVEQIQRKYAGIGPSSVSQPSNQDAEAVAWARSNPNDPRAARILSMHGM